MTKAMAELRWRVRGRIIVELIRASVLRNHAEQQVLWDVLHSLDDYGLNP